MTEQTTATPPAAPIPLVLPPASFTSLASILKAVPLQYPVTFAGRDWQAIHIRRFSVEQIAAIMENYRANVAIDPQAEMALPIYVDEACQPVPDGLLAKLDDDDRVDLSKAVAGFLPRRFQAAPAKTEPAGESTPPAGEATAP